MQRVRLRKSITKHNLTYRVYGEKGKLMENKKMHRYIISSERAWRRNDEYRNEFETTLQLEVDETVELDGLLWYVEEVQQ